MKRRIQAWLLAFTLILCQVCGGYAMAAIDESKSFTVTVLLDGQTEQYAQVDDILTVTVQITQDGAEDTFDLTTTQDTLLYDTDALEVVIPEEDVNGDGAIDIKDSFVWEPKPGAEDPDDTILMNMKYPDIAKGKIYFTTNIYMEALGTALTIPVNTRLLSFQVRVLAEGDTTIGHTGLKITKQSSTNYASTAVDATLHVISDELREQDTLTLIADDTMTYGETMALSCEGGSGSGDVSYAVTNGTGSASVNGGVLTATKAGTVSVTATKASDGEYAAASSEPQEITIRKATPSGTPYYCAITREGMTLADAALDVGDITPGGSIAWDLPEDTVVAINTEYGWTFTPDDTENYEIMTGSAVLFTESDDDEPGGSTSGNEPLSGGSAPSGATPNTPYVLSLVSTGTETEPSVDVRLSVISGTLDEYRSVRVLNFALDYDTSKLSLKAMTAEESLRTNPLLRINNGAFACMWAEPLTVGTEPITIATAAFEVVGSRNEDVPVGFTDEYALNTTKSLTDNALGALVGCGVAVNSSALLDQHPLFIPTTETTYGVPLTLEIAGGDGDGEVSYSVKRGDDGGNAMLNGNVLTPARAGTVTVIATKASDGVYATASSAPTTITIRKATPSGTPSYDAILEGDTLANAHLSVGSITPAGTITWDAGSNTRTEAGAAYNWTFTPKNTPAASYNEANYTILTGSISPAFLPQDTLTITSADTMTFGETLTLTCEGGSGEGVVTYKVTDGADGGSAKVINGNKLQALQAGTVTVTATKAAAGLYAAASSAPMEITIAKKTPSGEPSYAYIYDVNQTLADANLDWNTITFRQGVLAWDDGDETVVEANRAYRWTLTPDDTVNYNSITGTVVLYTAEEQQPLVINSADAVTYGDELALDVTGGSGEGAVTYAVSDESVAVIDENGVLTPVKAGTVTVTVTKAARYEYLVASTEQEITVNKATPTGAPDYELITDVNQTLADADLTVGDISAAGTVAWELPTDTVVAANTAYRWTFTPDYPDGYNSIDGSIVLYTASEQTPLTPTFDNEMTYGETLALTYDGGDGDGDVTYTVTNGTGEATVSEDGILTPVKAGTVTVTIAKAAKGAYLAASTAPVEITIAKATPTGEPDYSPVLEGGTLAQANLGIGSIAPAGSIAWDDGNDAVVEVGKTYRWTFTPDDTENYAILTDEASLTLQEQAELTITSADTMGYGGTLALTCEGGSGNGEVTWEITNGTGEAALEGNVLTATKQGTVTVVATKAALGVYVEKKSEPQTITIGKGTPSGEPSYTLITAVGRTLADAALGVGSITPEGSIAWVDEDGNELSADTVVEANVSYIWSFTPTDTENYYDTPVRGGIVLYIVRQQTALSIISANTVTYGETLTLTTEGGSSSGDVTYEVSDESIATVDENGVLTPIRAGTVTVVATKAADDAYFAVSSESVTITVRKATPRVDYDRITDVGMTLADTNLRQIGEIAGTLAWVDEDGDALPENTPVVANATYKWVFTPDYSDGYNVIDGSVTLYAAGEQTPIIITSASAVTYGETLTLTFRGGSGEGAVTYAVTNGTGSATVSENGVLTPVRAGTVSVTVTKAAKGAYLAVSAEQEITVNKATPTGKPSYEKLTTAGKTLADAKLTTGTITPAGSIVWDDGDETAVESGKTYNWTFTPEDTENYNKLSGTSETLYTAGSGGGAGGGGGGGAPGGAAPAETKPADGGVFKTNDNAVSAVVTATETTDGGCAAAISEKTGEELVNTAKKDGAKEVVISVEGKTDAASVTVSLPAKTVEALAKDTEASLTVESPAGSATISSAGLAALAERGGEVKLSIAVNNADGVRSASVIVAAGGNTVAEIAGGVKVTIPALSDTNENRVLNVVRSDGREEAIPFGIITSKGASVILEGSATVIARDASKEFFDMDGHWAIDDVNFVTTRGIFNGGDDGGFHPESTMTRGMLVKTLYNLERQQGKQYDGDAFADVAEYSWYKDSVGWAAKTGIMSGYGNGSFGPEDNVTREQVAKVLYSYVQYIGLPASADETELGSFPDQGEIDDWASDAMSWAVYQGLFQGTNDGMLNPQGEATRAEMATLMTRFVKLVLK